MSEERFVKDFELVTEGLDLIAQIRKDMIEELDKVWAEWVVKQTTVPPGWQGFTGLSTIFDEHDPPGTIWDYWERPKTFTPEEFNRLWDGFTEQRRIDYVLSLIER